MKKINLAPFLFTFLIFGFWVTYFSFGISEAALSLPEGGLIKTADTSDVYAITKGKKHWIPTPAVFNSYPGYKWGNIQIISQADLDKYPRVKHIKLANTSKVYYITESGLKRHVLNSEVFLSYGNKWEDIIEVNQTELNAYNDSELIRLMGDYKVYKIENNQKRWIETAEIFNQLGFDWSKIAPVNQTEFYGYFTGGPIISAKQESNKYPNTFILEGPEEDALLESNEISFKYSGNNPLGEVKNLSFETYLKGYDLNWKDQRTKTVQTFKLSNEAKIYTFYARAKNDEGYIDPTPASRTFQIGVSPFYQKMEIINVHPKEKKFENDYLILKNNSSEEINISGWTLKSKADSFSVPKAVNQLKYPFSAGDSADIRVPSRGEVLISFGKSPEGVNCRLNQCTGYLDRDKQFFPSLPKNCPKIEEEEYGHLKKTCRDFIKGLDSCEIPDYSGNWKISADNECTAFLNEKFNYNYCYKNNYLETNFLEDKWRVFLNKSTDILDNDSDKLILKDKNGFLADEYKY
ncbi:MAG: hypothetical protein A3A94_02830 [Candidatus Portnoybacteria bacterium RIFCSPLOWO2_01_FULL_43_11]|uniref:LTD domain-containing protein n=3 Tax=Candidatus Portnoyibacteriota TaxID=1817913 RepID=A0A1G2FAW4_9BACT|nr:MAG: hypothetical protein A2815_00905 [Candidatus Portnoybacteria bacterium RIFCSPHIGHO2_01_FULL_40_12b]OGZ36394.1 MAG: hypothetical protein A3D38_00895 [Candidatus Portnoybacteria bacterium RIFCSPHIGHO2_02_FULL_40_23]OGZ38497.1 MAG: hypothetical protein A3A94_02830 [Candidatus Portnoybacteria bacterium RIFCSPLOWO2_01_FULL_43_11]OGZ40046.1 MAG: hypothetical protein A3I20_01505 [Candidatus Portnoybacteria bacterium RIFCSPLOWO2_02_FULL_40_15]